MSDYSDEDFEMSGSGNAGPFGNPKKVNAADPALGKGAKKGSPFQQKKKATGGFQLAGDSDDDGYAPAGQGPTSNNDEYEDDDFDEEEEEQFKKTAVEFAKKLSALRESTNYQMAEGGEEPSNNARPKEESKRAVGRSVNRQAAGSSPPQSSYKNASKMRQNPNSDEITDAALKSPSMLKTTMDKQGKSNKTRANRSPSQQMDNSVMGGATGDKTNPFRFIEAALNEAKSKIEKMKNTPQILDSLPDDEKKKKFLKAENKLLRENLKRMSDNVNVLIEKMNQESMRKRRAAGGPRKGAVGSNVSMGGGMSMQGDAMGDVTIDETGRPIQGGVGSGLVPGNLPMSQKGLGAQSNAGHSAAGRGGYNNQSPTGRGNGSMNRGGASVAERELQNTDKAIVNLMKEHNKLKRRLEMIQQPDFLLNLKRDLKTTQEEIKQQEKLKRQLKVDQLRREKKLDNLIDQSEPDVLKQVQDTTQRLAYLTEKLAKLEEENKKAEELRNQQIDQLEELRNRLSKLNTIAEHYGVSVEKSKENMAEHKKLTEQLEHLQKQKRILTQAIDTQTRKQEALTAEKKRDLEQLQMRKGEILAKYNERVVELREKGLQIRDLIDRAKTEADDGLQDILDKWQQANERILEKYPEGSQMSFAQLEEAARNSIEYEQQEAQDQTSKNPRDRKSSVRAGEKGKRGATRTSIPPRDDEMQIYLSEIREKQESLINKLRYDQQAAQALQEHAIEESVGELQEESKQDAASSVAGSLKSKRNLVPQKSSVVDDRSEVSAASQAQAELAQLKAELEREKAEKATMAIEMAAEKERNAAEQRKAREQAAEKQRIKDEQNQQIMEGGQEVYAPAPILAPTPAPVQALIETVQPVAEASSVGRTSQVGSVSNSKPALGSKPKYGLSSKPSIGLKAPSQQTVVASSIAKPDVTEAQPFSQKGSRYEPTAQSIEVKTEVKEQPKPEEVQTSKPISFLDRARMNRKQPEPAAKDNLNDTNQTLDSIQKENDEARRQSIERVSETNNYNPMGRESTVGNQQILKRNQMGSVQSSMQSGYQPSTMQGQVPQNLNPLPTESIAPRRRRAGDSPKNQDIATSLAADKPRQFNDPFANVALTLGSNTGVGASLAPSQKKQSYEDKLKAEAASKGSFLDMIGGGAPATSSIAAPQKSINEPMMMKASVASAIPSQISSKPTGKPNLVATLDDLEDLA